MIQWNVTTEIIEGKGEDALQAGPSHLLVCDGLGGRGARVRRHADGRAWTEARIAAQAASQTVHEVILRQYPRWQEELAGADAENRQTVVEAIAAELEQVSRLSLKEAALEWQAQDSGAQAAPVFPTTLALWLVFPDLNHPAALALWAGDSRCYLMNRDRLMQVSVDDAGEGQAVDAMAELLLDASPMMSNRLGLDLDFHLNARLVTLEKEQLLLCATDGAYNALKSPMWLEYLLRKTAEQGTPGEQEGSISAVYRKAGIDDVSIAAGYLSFDPESKYASYQAMMANSLADLKAGFIDPFPDKPNLEGHVDTGGLQERMEINLANTAGVKEAFQRFLADRIAAKDAPETDLPSRAFIEKMREQQAEHDRQKEEYQGLLDEVRRLEVKMEAQIARAKALYPGQQGPAPAKEFRKYRDLSPENLSNNILQYLNWFVQYLATNSAADYYKLKPNEAEFGAYLREMLKRMETFNLRPVSLGQDTPPPPASQNLKKEDQEILLHRLRDPRLLKDAKNIEYYLYLPDTEVLMDLRYDYLEAIRKRDALQKEMNAESPDESNKIAVYVSQSLAQNLRHYLEARAAGRDSYRQVELPGEVEQKVLTHLESVRQGQEKNRELEARQQAYKAEIQALWSRYRVGYEAILRGEYGQ